MLLQAASAERKKTESNVDIKLILLYNFPSFVELLVAE